MNAWIVGIVAFLFLPQAVASGKDEAVTLARTYKVGQVLRIRENVISIFRGTEGNQTSTVKKQVKEIKPNGDVLLSSVFEGGHLKSPQGEQALPSGPLTDEAWDKHGRLLSWRRYTEADSFMAEETRQTMMAISGVIFPDKPVRAGDTWRSVIDSPFIKGKKITYATTFVGLETRDGRPLWKVKQAASAELKVSADKLTTDLTAWLDPANGQLIRARLSVKAVPTQMGRMDLTIITSAISEKDGAESSQPESKGQNPPK